MVTVRYDHHFKANGRYYGPGEEIEIGDASGEKKEQPDENQLLKKQNGAKSKKTE